MINWIDEYNNEEERLSEIALSEEYMDWLKRFLSRKYIITDKEETYYSDRIDNHDKKYIDLILYLFNSVETFFQENVEIKIQDSNSSASYYLSYKRHWFRIGFEISQVPHYFCERSTPPEGNIPHVDFDTLKDFYSKRRQAKQKKLVTDDKNAY